MKLTANGRRRLQLLTTILLVVTIVAIIYTLVAWIVSEPGSFEPLNVLFFAVLSGLTAVSAWLGRADNVAPPESNAVAEAETVPLGILRQKIADSFDLNELRTLCLDIGINYESFNGGGTIEGKSASLLAYMQRRNQLPQLMAALEKERPDVIWPMPAQLQSRYGLIQNVRTSWIDGVLKQSVTDEIALELKLTYQPQALVRTTLYVPGQVERPVEKDVPTLFAESGSLLILGEPGSGKTLTLLQLAESLLDVAEADPAQPTPVVLNLSSWAMHKGALPDWIVEELLLQYQLPRETSRRLIASGGLIYLLDGLDEVAAEARDACVQAINELKAQQPAPLVVCCRVAEYEGLAAKLNLGTAVCIQPLTDEQIDDYLRRPELKLTAVRQMVKTDAAMRELAQTPLFLSVMTLAYRDMKRADLKQLPTPEARRAHLYDHYVAEMWRRRPLNGNEPYDETQAMTWLTNLAHGMKQHEQTTFYIERLQPTWLPNLHLNNLYARCSNLVAGMLILCLMVPLFGSLIVLDPDYGVVQFRPERFVRVSFTLLLGGLLYAWLPYGLGRWVNLRPRLMEHPIKLVEELKWRPRLVRQMPQKQKRRIIYTITLVGGGLVFLMLSPICLALAVTVGLVDGQDIDIDQFLNVIVFLFILLLALLLIVIFVAILIVLYLTITIITENVINEPQPNRGIYNSLRNSLRMSFVIMLIAFLSAGLAMWLISEVLSIPGGVLVSIVISVIFGLAIGLGDYGGFTLIQHYILRWLLTWQEIFPFPRDKSFIAFMDVMKDRIFLRRAGGGWVFIHRTLLDYFASLHPDVAPAAPEHAGANHPDASESS